MTWPQAIASFIFLIPLLGVNSVRASTVQETTETLSTEFSLRPSLGLGVGTTSNASLIQGQEGGVFYSIQPNLSSSLDIGPDFSLKTTAQARFRRFTDAGLGEVGNSTSFYGKIEPEQWIGFHYRVGGAFQYQLNNSRSPFISESGVSAEPDRYSGFSGRTYGRWFDSPWAIELGVSVDSKDYSTLTTDLSGNRYLKDNQELAGDLSVEYQVSKKVRLKGKYRLGQQTYSNRMAEFTDGNPAALGQTLPLLEIRKHLIELSQRTKLGRTFLQTKASYQSDQDTQFGARSAQTYGFHLLASIALSSKTRGLRLKPSASLSKQDYTHFRSNLSQASQSDLREDWIASFGTTLAIPISQKVNFDGNYSFQRVSSNYSAVEYDEHALQGNWNIQF